MSDLREIQGIGKSIEQDLFQMGIFCVDDLKGQTIDRCIDKQSKWWDFKDEN